MEEIINNTQQNTKDADLHGHLWNDKDIPTLDDNGEISCYAKCSLCGAVENTDESILDCPKFLSPKPISKTK